MQMNEKVLTALEVLKDCAENDFEIHRIDVLIKDLTAPPKVEKVDDNHQKFKGITYYKTKDGHYVSHNGIHRDIWQYYNGEIPADNVYEIHHRNLNPADNNIENLQLLTNSEHRQIHIQLNKISPVTCICKNCGKSFETSRTYAVFCSPNCQKKILL